MLQAPRFIVAAPFFFLRENAMPRILIHACCGPCSLMPIVHLRDEGWEPSLLFFNPNIHPAWEWERRRDAIMEASEKLSVFLMVEGEPQNPGAWVRRLNGVVREGARCRLCYRPRLDLAAARAADLGFDAFTTSLLYSRYQHHDVIREEAELAAEKHAVAFLYRDFREWWYDGIRMSRELGIYRQKWCGCILSMGEALRMQKEAEQIKMAKKAENAARLAAEAEERRLRQEALAAKKARKAKRREQRLAAREA